MGILQMILFLLQQKMSSLLILHLNVQTLFAQLLDLTFNGIRFLVIDNPLRIFLSGLLIFHGNGFIQVKHLSFQVSPLLLKPPLLNCGKMQCKKWKTRCHIGPQRNFPLQGNFKFVLRYQLPPMSITPPIGCLLSIVIIGLIDYLGILFGLQMLTKEAFTRLLGILAA